MQKKITKVSFGIILLILIGSIKNVSAQAVTTLTFNYTGSLQTWTVPQCAGNLTIEARGAQGGSVSTNNSSGGYGASMKGVFTSTAGVVLNIIVGQMGNSGTNTSGGGGGSGVNAGTVALIVAGGGGGVDFQQPSYAGMHAPITTSGNPGQNSGGVAGAAGSDGGDWIYSNVNISRGGRGWNFLPNGSTGQGGVSANTQTTAGTWGIGGGGGSVGSGYCNCGGGGGGYSGGGAGNINNSGGGGGSFNAGSNQINVAGTNTGNGKVYISYIAVPQISMNISPASFICSGQSVTIAAQSGLNSYSWTGVSSTANSVIVNPTSNTSYTLAAINASGGTLSSVVNSTVNAGAPQLTITPGSHSVCLGKTTTLTASGANQISWAGGITNGGTFTPNSTATYTVSGYNGCSTTTVAVTVTVAPLPVGVSSSQSVVCYGSAAMLTAVSTGTTYTWTPGFMSSSSVNVAPTVNTTYTVAASDGTCSGNNTISIGVNPVPTLQVVGTTTAPCSGYNVTITATGAQTYSWLQSGSTSSQVVVTPTAPVLHQVVGYNQFNCSSVGSWVMVPAQSPSFNLVANSTLVCSGDNVTVTAIGNTNNYFWSNSATGSVSVLNPLNLTVITVTAISTNSCETVKSTTINVFTPTISVSGNTAVCPGKSTTLTGNGADLYDWVNFGQFQSIVVSPTASTVYSLSTSTTSDNVTCNSSTVFLVTVHPIPSIAAAATKTVACVKGEQINLTASGGSTYTWTTPSGSNIPGSALTLTSSLTGIQVYTLNGTDANGCNSKSTIQVRFNSCSGIVENESQPVNIYPNPSHGNFIIVSKQSYKLNLFNSIGQFIQAFELNSENNFEYRVNNLPPGVYILSTPDLSYQKRIIIQ